MAGLPESYGSELRCCRLDGIRVAEVAMPAGLRLNSHAHTSGQLVFVLEGRYWESWGGRRVRLRPGSTIFRPPGQAHANAFRDDVLALVVSYDPRRLHRLASGQSPMPLPFLLDDLRRQVHLELRRDDHASRTALEGLALLLLSRLERTPGTRRQPAWLGDALALIRRHHAEAIGLTTVAGTLGIHRATVASAFRRYLGRSVGEAIRDARLDHALVEIRTSRRPLAEIALDCGFYDQAHMGRCVRRSTGRTPGEIRNGL